MPFPISLIFIIINKYTKFRLVYSLLDNKLDPASWKILDDINEHLQGTREIWLDKIDYKSLIKWIGSPKFQRIRNGPKVDYRWNGTYDNISDVTGISICPNMIPMIFACILLVISTLL